MEVFRHSERNLIWGGEPQPVSFEILATSDVRQERLPVGDIVARPAGSSDTIGAMMRQKDDRLRTEVAQYDRNRIRGIE